MKRTIIRRSAMCLFLIGLTGCGEPITNPMTDRMDAFFNSIGQPPPAPPDYRNSPGYAPAYPPNDTVLGPSEQDPDKDQKAKLGD